MLQRRFLFIALLLLQGAVASAFTFSRDFAAALRGDHTYQSYYAISTTTSEPEVSLLHWEYIEDPSYQAPETYKRTQHFEGWIGDPTGKTCFNVRNLVLQRQALQPITLDPKNSCRILKSSWYDPYSDEYFLASSELQIDHVVPLKNAYLAGAWSWSPARRCHFENFLDDNTHLIAVEKTVNLSKGERGPETFLPINSRFQCHYLAIWLRIKAIWQLKIAVIEAEGIRYALQANRCDPNLFKIHREELQALRQRSYQPPESCLTLMSRRDSDISKN